MTKVQLHYPGDGGGLGISATFDDGSRVSIVPQGVDAERRQCYAYSVTRPGVPRIVAAACDLRSELRSGVGEPVNLRKALAAWVSFAGADADSYRATMTGDAMQEWAYQHDTELSELAADLDDEDPATGGTP